MKFMNPEKNNLTEEQLELEEQAIGEPTYKTVAEMTNEEIDEIAPVE